MSKREKKSAFMGENPPSKPTPNMHAVPSHWIRLN